MDKSYERARTYGLTSTSIAQTVSQSVRGVNLRRIRGEQSEIDVILALKNSDRQSITDLQELPIWLKQPVIQIIKYRKSFEETNAEEFLEIIEKPR